MLMPDDDVLYCTDLDDAFVGFSMRYGDGPLATYDIEKIIKILMERDGMDRDGAVEFYDFNIGCLYAGKRTPVLVWEGVEHDGTIN